MDKDLYHELKVLLDLNNFKLRSLILKKHFEMSPELTIKYSEKQKNYYLRDIGFNLSYLAQAINLQSPNLFSSYSKWLKNLMQNLGVSLPTLIANFQAMSEVLKNEFPSCYHEIISSYIEEGTQMLTQEIKEKSTLIDPTNHYSKYAEEFLLYVLNGRKSNASELILSLVKNGVSIKKIYIDILQQVQYEIGHLWQTNKISIAQEHYATSVTQLVISQMYPYLFTGKHKNKVLLTSCVSGELHEIGLRMLTDIFEIEGWDTWYLGANLPDESIIEMVKEKKPDIIALSVTVMFYLEKLKSLIEEIRKAGITTPIMVGGYPFINDKHLWKKIGADGWAIDPERALNVADKLIKTAGSE